VDNMVRVTLSGKVLAESTETIVVENNHYFPPQSVDKSLLTTSATSSVCPWKGIAAYYSAKIDGQDEDVAWYYPDPKEKATNIKDYVAFYKGKPGLDITE